MTHTGSTITLMSAPPLAPQASGDAPEWVHLLPFGADGQIVTGDRRGPYLATSPEQIIADSFALNDRIPIDENHALDRAAPMGLASPAYGWITAMQAREDGIWGRVEWTRKGAELVADRAYRGLSPAIRHDAQKRVSAILRASLVNTPNLRGMVALHNQESEMTLLERLAELLGLDAASSEKQIVDAVTALHSQQATEATALQSQIGEIGVALGLTPDTDGAAILAAARQARQGANEQVTALQSELAGVSTQLKALQDQAARDKATGFIDGEIRKGRVGVKPLRDHYIAQHMIDPTRVEKEITALPVLGDSGSLVTAPVLKDGQVALNSEQLQVARMLGQKPEDYAATLKDEQHNEEAL